MNQNPLSKFLGFKILTVILMIKLFTVIFFQVKYSSDYSLTKFYDDDGAAALMVSDRTELLNNNKWFAYGPVYYRLARVLTIFSQNATINDDSKRQEHLYFILIFTSLICSLVVFLVIFSNTDFVLSINLSLIAFHFFLITSNETFLAFFLRPHPDFALSLMLLLAAYFMSEWYSTYSKKSFYLSFIFLGIAVSTKITAIYFCVGFGMSYLIVGGGILEKKKWLLLFKGIAVVLIAYFVIGFPQNFKVMKTLDFLQYQSKFHLKPSFESVGNWHMLLIKSTWPLLLLAPFLSTASPRRYSSFNFLLLFFTISFIIFSCSVHTAQESSYYIIPFAFLLWFAVSRYNFQTVFYRFSPFFCCGALILSLGLPLPKYFTSSIAAKDECREVIKDFIKLVNNSKPNFAEVVYDAYVPYELGNTDRKIWGLLPSMFNKDKTLFMVNAKFFQRFLDEASSYVIRTNPDFLQHRKFYQKLRTEVSFSSDNIMFNRLFSNECGLSVWSATKSSEI